MNAGRRAVVEFALDAADHSRVQVGSRTLYHYWGVLNPFFRGVFVPPQRRTDSENIAWIWTHPVETDLPSAEELRTLRRKVSDAHRLFVDAVSTGRIGSSLNEDDGELLCSRMGRIVANLVAMADRELIGFTASTTHGWMIHSWGSPAPGEVQFPDERALRIAGRCVQGQTGVSSVGVSLFDAEDRAIDQCRTDSSGYFTFPKLTPGRYRVAVTETRAGLSFSEASAPLSNVSIEDLELRAGDAPVGIQTADTKPPRAVARRRGGSRTLWVGGVLAVAGVLTWLIFREPERNPASSVAREGTPNVARGAQPLAQRGEAAATRLGAGSAADMPSSPERQKLRLLAPQSQEDSFSSATRSAGGSAPGIGNADTLQPNQAGGADGERDLGGSAPASGAVTAAPPKGLESKGDASSADKGKATIKPWARVKKVTAASVTDVAGAGEPESGNNPAESKSPDSDASPPKPLDLQPGALRPSQLPAALVSKEAEGTPARTGDEAVPGEDEAPETHRSTGAGASAGDASTSTPASDSEASQTSTPKSTKSPQRSVAPPRQNGGHAGNAAATSGNETAPATDASELAPLPEMRGRLGGTSGYQGGTQAAPQASNGERAPTPKGDQGAVSEPSREGEDEAVAAAAGAGAASEDSEAELPWGPVVRLHLRPWVTRLTLDEIVPTLPVPAGKSDAAQELWSTRWKQRSAAMPLYFRRPALKAGIALERIPSSAGELAWINDEGRGSVALSAASQAAELGWPAVLPPRAQTASLRDAQGREWAIVRTTPSGQIFVRTRVGLRARHWISIQKQNTAVSAEPARLHWRTDLSGLLPDTWEVEENWEGAGRSRLLIPLEGAEFSGRWVIQLLDTGTGWALAGDVQVGGAD